MTDLFLPGSRLLVFGYFGGRNFGDELMLRGILEEAGRADVAECRIVTPSARVPPGMVDAVGGAYPRSVSGILSGLLWANCFTICGGTVLHDAFPDARYRTYRRVLIGFTLLCWLARVLTPRVILAGVGIGPARRPLTRLATRLAIRAADLTTVRDQASLDELRRLGVPENRVRRTGDLSLSAASAMPQYAPQTPPLLSISMVPANLVSTNETSEAERFIADLADAVARFASAHPHWQIAIFEVAVGAMDNDEPIARFLSSHLASAAPSRVQKVVFDGNPQIFLNLLAASSAVIASRYHIATAAEVIGAPTLWIPYGRKVIDAAETLKVPPERVHLPVRGAVNDISSWLEDCAAPVATD